MQFSFSTVALAGSLLLGSAAASPVETRSSPSERLYLVNCHNDGANIHRAELNYYKVPATFGLGGTQPDSVAQLPTFEPWEGFTRTGTFPAGDYASCRINANGKQQPENGFAGTCTHSSGQKWNCYNSVDEPIIHRGANDPNYICHKIYWCKDA